MQKQEVKDLLVGVGAIITDSHFVYNSGHHGSKYINKDALYPHIAETSLLCRALAEPFSVLEHRTEVVVGPALGGIVLSQWTAHHLGLIQGNTVLAVYAEKDEEGLLTMRRGYDKLVVGKQVLVVEDILNTGRSARRTVEAVRAAGGEVVGVSALCNRGDVTREHLGVRRMESLLDFRMYSYPEDRCHLCRDGVPINTELGHSAKFLAKKRV